MANDTTSKEPGAKLDQTQPISGEFNKQNTLADLITSASPRAQEKAKMLLELRDERLENEKRTQQRHHSYRLYRTRVELLENYIMDPSPRPDGVRADPAQDVRIIREQAERMVSEREEFYQRHIEREAEANIRQVIANDRQGREVDRTSQDQEHEQER